MANLKKLSPNKSFEHQLNAILVNVFIQKKCANPRLTIAFSGGLDSTVLLHVLFKINKTLPFKLCAHHVHHGLSTNADAWADFCSLTCANLGVPLTISNVNISKNSGLGVEATAREARYKALLSTDVDLIVLAHHQDDQAETLLLQLARGAGVKGLAGMAIMSGKLLRPLLDVPRSHLAAYAKQHQLTWIEDESNADLQFDRNFMRHKVLPIVEESYPRIRQTLSRSAQHMADANALLDELALLDALQAGFNANKNATVGTSGLGLSSLNLSTLKNLSKARINNCLRWWLAQNGLKMPSQQQLLQIVQQLLGAKADAAIQIKVSDFLCVMRYQGYVYLVPNIAVSESINLLWQGEECMILPDNSRLIFTQKMGEGFALNRFKNIKLRIKNREGGERFKPALGRPYRSLKQVLQTHAMPPWQREKLPLIFMDETLVIIPNVGVDANLQASNNEMGLMVNWFYS